MAFLALFACLVLLPVGRAWAIRGQVVDAAEFFKPETQDQADQMIRDIKQRFGKDVMVETYPAIPAELRAAFQRKGKNGFYNDWSNQRFRALHVNGVYILVTRNPGRVEVAVGNVTQQQAFTLADRDELLRVMIEPFRAGKFDDALLNGLDFIRTQMERNINAGGPAPEPLPPGPAPAPGPGSAPAPTAPGPEPTSTAVPPTPSNPTSSLTTNPAPAAEPTAPAPPPAPATAPTAPTTGPGEPAPSIHLPPSKPFD